MKNIIRLLMAFTVLTALLTACYDDKGNYDYRTLPTVRIEVKDTIYATQFTQLDLPVEIEYLENANEDDYEFSWRIWANDLLGTYQQTKDICLTKDLHYEVTEVPGTYTLTLTCHNRKTGVDTYKSIFMGVQGTITEGWMVLNERDGQTDFDYIMSPYFSNRVTEDNIVRNVYESVNHEKLIGRGVKIGSFFSIGRYQETVVITDKGGARLDVSTMQKTFDMSTLSQYMTNYNPVNYISYLFYYGPARFGYDAIISDGHLYLRSAIGAEGFNLYTEPICRDGLVYRASQHAPNYVSYCNGIIYDDLNQRLLRVSDDGEWEFIRFPDNGFSGVYFTESEIKGDLRFMLMGFRNWEYGLFRNPSTNEYKLLAFDFTEYKNMDRGKYILRNCPEIDNATNFEMGSLGPIMYYSTDRDIYLVDYEGSGTARKVYTLANPNEKITHMKLYKTYADRYFVTHPYYCKVLMIATYDESTREGKLYMYRVNVSNGVIDMSSEKIIDGFGEILDMQYNFPKYGS